jgi:hypothetical protein
MYTSWHSRQGRVRVGRNTSAYNPGSRARIYSTRESFFSFLVLVVLRIIADKEFARPGRSCFRSSLIEVFYISQTRHGTRVRWRGWEGDLRADSDMRV